VPLKGAPGGGGHAAGPDLPAWVRAAPGGSELSIVVGPGARKTELVGEADGALRLKVAAPPVEGAANDAVLRFVAKELLGVAKGKVRLVAGDRSRQKRLFIELPADELAQALRAALPA
jgi:uncharacterized protein (TIGR00251 family)